MKKTFRTITGNWFVFFAYISLFILLSIAVVTVITGSRKIAARYNDLSDKATSKLLILLNNRENIENIQKFTIDKVFHPTSITPEGNQKFDELIQKSENNLKSYEQLAKNGNEKKAFGQLEQKWNSDKQVREKFISLKNNQDEALKYFHSIQQASYNSLQNPISS